MNKVLTACFILLLSVSTLSGKTPEICGVEITTVDNNRICLSLNGKITRITINGRTDFLANFDTITKIGDAKIIRDLSGGIKKVGHAKISCNPSGAMTKIGDAEITRDRFGNVNSVRGDASVTPVFKIAANGS